MDNEDSLEKIIADMHAKANEVNASWAGEFCYSWRVEEWLNEFADRLEALKEADHD